MPIINFDIQFKDLFENTSDLIHFVTVEGYIELVNITWLNTLGYAMNEVEGKSIYDFIHPDFIQEYKLIRSEAIHSKRCIELITTFITKGGEQVKVEGQIGCSYINDVPSFTSGVFKNITAKNIAEKRITANEKRLKAFFQNGPDAIIVINEQQQIIEWNSKAEIIFGYSAADVMGKLLSETIIPGQYREAHKAGMAHFLKTGEGPVLSRTIEITALHKMGHEFFINLSISNLQLEGEWLFIAFVSDITQRKTIEKVLIQKEAELLQAKLLEDKKDEFISIASHELKTPLTIIKGFVELALDKSGDIPEDILNCLFKIDQQTDKLHFLISELMDASRVQAGKLLLTKMLIEINLFLPEVLNSLQQITLGHTIILESNEPAKLDVDPLRLEQVITNIISNAAKYSPGQKKIVINSFKKEKSFIISVTDFGIGIPDDKRTKVFDRFYRTQEAEKRFNGLGIGLFISSEIIKQHGGHIWVESHEGKGSTFYFSLPLADIV